MDSSRIRSIKVTIVGDGAVGKTSMLITYTTKQFPLEYIPTIFDNYAEYMTVDGKKFKITFWDTAGQEDYERLRPLSYPNTDCFILCYSVNSRASYENVNLKWFPELKKFSPMTPIILVGTKKDLRVPNINTNITVAKGKRLKKEINAASFFECSALTGEGLREVFVEAVRTVKNKNTMKSKLCTLL
ncbi:ras-like GTP-binding protein RhoL [Arctopsyche grandis]|uniref:ras-like GTP-binding protein RhoL n=1 Tax=Arctopsyche grandis TaxID=121162 RepID=UPI00406D6851